MAMARAMVAALSDGAVLLDDQLVHVGHNQAYATMMGFGRRVEHVDTAQVFPQAIDGEADPLEVMARASLSANRVMRVAELPVTNGKGHQFTLHLTFVPVANEAGKPVGVMIISRDVSDEARIQARYRELLALERARAKERERQIEARNHEVALVLEEVTRLSRIDSLTGLLNRRAFDEHAEQAIDMARRHDRTVALLMCDLDRFKKLNDTFGHAAGDTALKMFARGLGQCFRASDKLARFGGEEFVVLLTETSADFAAEVAARVVAMCQALPIASEVAGFAGTLTVSIGVAMFPAHGDTFERIVVRADQALYAAKEAGRNQVVVFNDNLRAARSAEASGKSRQRVILVDPDQGRAHTYANALAGSYDVTCVSSDVEALERCHHEPYDVLVADRDLGVGTGTELLWKSLRVQPNALRILVIETRDMFLQLREAHIAQIDVLLLREDCARYLLGALEDGLDRRQLRRQQALTNRGPTQQAYLAQIGELEALLDDPKISFHYQPILRADTQKLFAYEALCRVEHAVFRDPSTLFEAAIQSGNIWKLSRLARTSALRPLPRLGTEALMFVNLHPTELDDPMLLEAPPAHGRVVFEITERAAMPDGARFLEMVEVLRSRGYRFAIDDLGAGYASLNSVAMLGPDFLKIDMSMTRDIHKSPRKAKLVKRIIDFANDEGIQAIAEGIEVAEEADTMRALGCHLLQGYLLGAPKPLD
jgi:diguanylate cyclase (GGDEF)-like protein